MGEKLLVVLIILALVGFGVALIVAFVSDYRGFSEEGKKSARVHVPYIVIILILLSIIANGC
jgi:hypothetical protein